MRTIDRKIFRNLWTLRSQALAIAFVIASGIAMSVMSFSTLSSLHETRNVYYRQFRFAEVFASFKRGPLTLKSRITNIPGVSRVQTRIVKSVNLIVEGLREPAVGRLISIPDHSQPELNRIHLRLGRMPESGRFEVVVGESFANVHNILPGATIDAILNGRLQTLSIVGIALSPEHIVEINAADVLPDFEHFGIFWVPQTEMEAAFDMKGACNDISLTLLRGANEKEVIRQLDNLLDDYGGIGSYGRDDQMSHRFISDEIDQLRAMGLVTPLIFIAVASFLLNIVIKRIVDMQREQIAALKAFGYHNYEVAIHYLKLVSLIVLAGISLGIGLGVWMGRGLTKMYTQFLHFPIFQFDFEISTTLFIALICSFAAFLGTIGSLHSAGKLPPAEAMRPKSPGEYRRSILERFGLFRWLPQTWRMMVRNIQRKPIKSILSILGIAMAAGVVVLGNYSVDALDFIVDHQFHQAQRQDLWVNLAEASPPNVVHDFQHLPGVTRVESFRAIPVQIRFGHRSRRISILGMEAERNIFRILSESGQLPSLRDDGLVISKKLADLLEVRVGSLIEVEVLEGKRNTLDLRIAGTVDDLSGTNAFALRSLVNRISQEDSLVSGAWLSVDTNQIDDLYTQLKETPSVVGVTAKKAAIKSFLDTVGENQLRMQGFVIIFAIVIAAGVVYNTARITLSEHDREFATMRVLGFTKSEVSVVLLGELAILTLIAIPVGLVFGYLMVWLASLSIHTDLFRIPFVIYDSTYGKAVIVVVVAAIASGFIVRRHLNKLDLFSVLKGQE